MTKIATTAIMATEMITGMIIAIVNNKDDSGSSEECEKIQVTIMSMSQKYVST